MKPCTILILLPLLLFVTGEAVKAQDLTGVWHGHFRSGNMTTSRSTIFDDRYKFEVQIAQNDKSLEAVTYSYLSSFFYGKAAATGTINRKTGKVIVQEVKLLEVRNQSGEVCIMTCFLQYSKVSDEEYLEGTYTSMNARDSSNCGRGTVFLRRVVSTDFYKEPFLVRREKEIEEDKAKVRKDTQTKTETVKIKPRENPVAAKTPPPVKTGTAKSTAPAPKPLTATTKPHHPAPDTAGARRPAPRSVTPSIATNPPSDSNTGIERRFPVITPKILQARANVLVKTITVHTNQIELNIYDDGAIDHDTISVYLDNKLVLSHRMLTDRPLTVEIHMDENEDYHELVMVAENEGEIPPNTSLMIVKAGDKEYEVRITSTEQKNAKVIFKFEKPK